MKKHFNENLFTILIILSMVSLPLLEFIGLPYKRRFFYQEELLSGIGILISIVLLSYFIINFFRNKKNFTIKFVLSDFFVITSILFCVISIIFSKDTKNSLTGEYMYSETPLQVLAYFALFFMCTLISKKENKKSILEIFIFLGIIESIIAFLQNFSLWPIPPLFDAYSHETGHMAFGLTQHCNFFAALSTIFTAICTSKFIYTNEKKISILYFLFSIITCISTFFTYTRIAWLGILAIIFGIVFLEIFIYAHKKDRFLLKKHIFKIGIIFLSFLICFLIIGTISGQIKTDFAEIVKDINGIKNNNFGATTNINNTNSFEEFGTRRGTIWKVGLNALIKYPFTGVGFDNYRYCFDIYSKDFGWSQNKGHNEYIHTLVTQGFFSGINYLAFAFYCCLFPFKKILKSDTEFAKSNLTKMGLLLPTTEQKNLFEIKFFSKNKN